MPSPRPGCTGSPAWSPDRGLTAWAALRERPLLVFAFVTFIAMLSGLPPFPGFYAKWELVACSPAKAAWRCWR